MVLDRVFFDESGNNIFRAVLVAVSISRKAIVEHGVVDFLDDLAQGVKFFEFGTLGIKAGWFEKSMLSMYFWTRLGRPDRVSRNWGLVRGVGFG